MTDFLDKVQTDCGGRCGMCDRCAATIAEDNAAIDAPAKFVGSVAELEEIIEPFTGYRCDRQGCGAAIAGRTETRAQLHVLTARAESLGWQCVHVDGKTLHFCRDHTDERYPPKRRHYP